MGKGGRPRQSCRRGGTEGEAGSRGIVHREAHPGGGTRPRGARSSAACPKPCVVEGRVHHPCPLPLRLFFNSHPTLHLQP